MEAVRLLLGGADLEAAHDPHRGLLVLRVTDVEAAGGALDPPRSPSPSPVERCSTSRSRSPAWRPRPPGRRPPTPPPPPDRSLTRTPSPEPAPAAPARRRRRRGNRAGQRERERRVARACQPTPAGAAPAPSPFAREATPPRRAFAAPPDRPSPFRVSVSSTTYTAPLSASPFFLQPVPQCLPRWLRAPPRCLLRSARP